MTRFTQAEHCLVELVEGEGDWCDSSSKEEDEIEDNEEIEEDDESDYSDEDDENDDLHLANHDVNFLQ